MLNKEIDILTIRQHFASSINPTSSYWVYEQIKDIMLKGKKFAVIAPQPYIPSLIRQKTKYKSLLPYSDEFNGVKVYRPSHFRIPNYKFYWITNYFLSTAIKNVADRLTFKLIHAHFGNDGVASLPLKRKYNVPLITSFYGYDLSDQLKVLKPYYKELAINGDLFLALSKDMKYDLVKIGFPENKIKIHHLGVNFDEINKFYKKETPKEINNFLIVARFSERKGIHIAIKAFYNVIKEYPKLELRIIGNGEYKNYLVSLVSDLNLNENVIFIDNFQFNNPREIVLKEIAKCDVFVLTSYKTSKGSKEGTPIVLMEAQALGKPCISTFHAGIPEIVIHNKTGILVKEKDVHDLEVAMKKIIQNKNLAWSMGNKGRLIMLEYFNNAKQNKKLNEIYNKYLT